MKSESYCFFLVLLHMFMSLQCKYAKLIILGEKAKELQDETSTLLHPQSVCAGARVCVYWDGWGSWAFLEVSGVVTRGGQKYQTNVEQFTMALAEENGPKRLHFAHSWTSHTRGFMGKDHSQIPSTVWSASRSPQKSEHWFLGATQIINWM